MSQQDVANAGWSLVQEFEGSLGKSSQASAPVKDAFEMFKSGAATMTAAADKFEADWSANKQAQLEGKPNGLYNEDRFRLKSEASDIHREGLSQAEQAYRAIRLIVRTEVLPKASDKPEQQLLDRQMLDLSLGDGDGATMGSKALRIAQSGDQTLQAMLISPYGRAKLKAAGVHERTIEDVEDTIIATSNHPSAELARSLSRLQGAVTALDTDWRMRTKGR